MTDVDQAQAPETAPAPSTTPQSAGAMLRQMRERAGVHPEVLASALKVTPAKIHALESDALDQLPDVTFARGLAAAICRAFGNDPAPVLERLPAVAKGLGVQSGARPINEPFRRASDHPTPLLASRTSRAVLLAAMLLLLGAAVLWLLPTLPIQLAAPESATTQENVTPMPPMPAVEPGTPAEAPASVASAEPGASALAVPATTAPAAVASAAEATAGATGDLLSVSAIGETWLTVRDSTGKQLFNRALAKGEVASVSGEVPLSVTIGRKDSVRVQVRGEPFDVNATSRTNVARFQVK